MKKSFVLKIGLTSLLFISIVSFGLYIILQSQNIVSKAVGHGTSSTERKYNILVTGTSSVEAFVRQVYRGAQSRAQKYDCSIELYVPENFESDISLQKIFDYASYIEPDGLIAFIPEGTSNVTAPVDASGRKIPLVTFGQYLPELEQISFIGINYSELGQIVGNEIISSTDGKGNICILHSDFQNNQIYSLLMKELLKLTSARKNLNIENLHLAADKNNSEFDLFRQNLSGASPYDLLVSLSEENTVLAAQTITELNQAVKTEIIGLSEGAESRAYYEREIINELIVINSLGIGARAVEEIFKYKNSGQCSSYIIADIDILKRGRQK